MSIRVRVGAFFAAAGALVAPVVMTAAPAQAGSSTSISPASCTAQGGTFSRSKGVKSCTTSNPSWDCNNVSDLYAEEPAVTAGNSGYFGRYTANLCYQTTTVQTQKGTGPISTTTTSTLKSRIVLSYDSCGYYDSATFSSSYADVYQCVDAGDVYPATFYG